MKHLRANQHFGLSNSAVRECTIFWVSISAQREGEREREGCRCSCLQGCYLQLHSDLALLPAMNPACCRRMLQVLCLGEPLNHSAVCFAVRNGDGQREIDGETDREEAEVCLHLCDNV